MKPDYLAAIKQFYGKAKRLPSYSEMLDLFGLSSKNAVHKIVHKWIEDGLLKKENSKLAPTGKFFALPLLGMVRAGQPILADENKSYLTLDEYLIDDPSSSFLLKVRGDSMVNAGIFEDDLVIIDMKRSALSGDIVLAEIDKEWTLKYLKKDKNRIYLEAANDKYPPLHPKKELKVHGVVMGVIRKFRS
ncbi:MAG: transcriptional repressor LexA [Patescibacteria group bacterium]|nr:transcriptional repressor LexA [Patescibacteria group bacterium]